MQSREFALSLLLFPSSASSESAVVSLFQRPKQKSRFRFIFIIFIALLPLKEERHRDREGEEVGKRAFLMFYFKQDSKRFYKINITNPTRILIGSDGF